MKMGQDSINSSKKSAGNGQDDGEIAMAHADASVVENPAAQPSPPPIPLSEIALTGIYEISKILNAPNRLETTLSSVLNVLSSFLQMRHGVISLLADDDVPDITVGIGWNEGTDERYRARLPETAIGQIERTHFVARAASSHAQSGGFPSRHVFRIGLEITEILALQGIRSAQLMHKRALDGTDGIFAIHLRTVRLGSVGRALRHRAGDGRDHDIL